MIGFSRSDNRIRSSQDERTGGGWGWGGGGKSTRKEKRREKEGEKKTETQSPVNKSVLLNLIQSNGSPAIVDSNSKYTEIHSYLQLLLSVS